MAIPIPSARTNCERLNTAFCADLFARSSAPTMLITTVTMAATFGAIAAMARNGRNPILPVVAFDVLYPSPDASSPKAVKNIAAFQSCSVGAPVVKSIPTAAAAAASATAATTIVVLNLNFAMQFEDPPSSLLQLQLAASPSTNAQIALSSDVIIDIEIHLPSRRSPGIHRDVPAKIGSAHASVVTLPLMFSPLRRERGVP